MANETFGEVIKNARKSCGLTLRQLAEDVGISHPYLSQLENGRNTNPSPTVVYRLADNLRIPFAYLLFLADESYVPEEDGEELERLKAIGPLELYTWDTLEEFKEVTKIEEIFSDAKSEGDKMKSILDWYQYFHSLKMTERTVKYQVELEDAVQKTNKKLESNNSKLVIEPRKTEVSLESLLFERQANIIVNKKPLNDNDKKKLIALADILFNTK